MVIDFLCLSVETCGEIIPHCTCCYFYKRSVCVLPLCHWNRQMYIGFFIFMSVVYSHNSENEPCLLLGKRQYRIGMRIIFAFLLLYSRIIDESSMIDMWLAKQFFTRVKPSTEVILVGDVDQPQSVGAGDVFRELINCGKISVTVLNEIFRQKKDSLIAYNAKSINDDNTNVMTLYL